MIIDDIALLFKSLIWIGVIAVTLFVTLGPIIELLFNVFLLDVYLSEDKADEE